ncbi:MAG: hypothetical protein P8X98_15155 [Woeseiaceae bacterium]
MPRDYHPLADALTDDQLEDKLVMTRKTKMQPMDQLPSHDEFLEMYTGSG